MTEVVVIRPGCTDFDEQRRIQGSLDLPLNRRGQEQVECLVRRLRDVPLDVVFSPPCEPARSTAIAICEASGATFKELDDFRNLNYGLWQGLQVDDVRRKYPKVFKQWHESPLCVCLPEGETVAEAMERIERALRKCLKRKRTVGIVASEPLATLIVCALRRSRPELPVSSACEHPEGQIEVLQVADDDAKRFRSRLGTAPVGNGNGSVHGDGGQASNGHAASALANKVAVNGQSNGKHPDSNQTGSNRSGGTPGVAGENGTPTTREPNRPVIDRPSANSASTSSWGIE
jgi:broad specificity phosphatase PhoE